MDGKTTYHYQAKVNPFDDEALYTWLETALRRHARRASPPKAALYELYEAWQELETMKAGKSIEAMLQQILDAVANGVPKGKGRKEAVAQITGDMGNFLARLRNVSESDGNE